MKLNTVFIVSLFLIMGKSYANGTSTEEIDTLIEKQKSFEERYKELNRQQEKLDIENQNMQRLEIQNFSQIQINPYPQGYWPQSNGNFGFNPYGGMGNQQVFTCSPDGSVCTNAQGINYIREGASELGDRDGGKQDEGNTPEFNIKDLKKSRVYSF